MLPSETQKIIDQHGIKYVLAQFVDIQGGGRGGRRLMLSL